MPVTTAVLGGEVSVVTLGGKTVRVKMPETTQPGLKLRLRGPRAAGARRQDGGRRSLRRGRRGAAPLTERRHAHRRYEELATVDESIG